MLRPGPGSGQADGEETRRLEPEVAWLDTVSGRYLLSVDSTGWLSINPLRHDELRHQLRHLISRARAPVDVYR